MIWLALAFLLGNGVEYQRSAWPHWLDTDGDCQNARHEALISQAIGDVTLSPDGCKVLEGLWLDPYSGTLWTEARQLDADHVIPLKWAHDHGGDAWTELQRVRFANDPSNVLMVSASLNRQKGALGPSVWRPPSVSGWCEYSRRWLVLTARYGLEVPDRDQLALEIMAETCD